MNYARIPLFHPVPNSDKVSFAEIPERSVAVLTYGFYTNEAGLAAKKKKPLENLKVDGITANGEITSAHYNPLFSMPFIFAQ